MSAEEIALRTDRARGLMLGLLLADCVDQWDQPGPLTGTCLSQLACFTLEGGIRAHERAIHKGICHVPSVIWHAWCRWADIQGLGPQFAAYWGGQSGWLHQVRPLADRRGSAPTTVNALLASPRAPETPATNSSAGHHALTRVLPLAILAPELRRASETAYDLAQYTHGHPGAWSAAADGVRIAAAALSGSSEVVDEGIAAPPGTAAHALYFGARSAAGAGDFAAAVRAARASGEGPALVAGALYGALHGTAALRESPLRRHDLTWVADQLARDAIHDLTQLPAGTEYEPASDPTWWARYPGG